MTGQQLEKLKIVSRITTMFKEAHVPRDTGVDAMLLLLAGTITDTASDQDECEEALVRMLVTLSTHTVNMFNAKKKLKSLL